MGTFQHNPDGAIHVTTSLVCMSIENKPYLDLRKFTFAEFVYSDQYILDIIFIALLFLRVWKCLMSEEGYMFMFCKKTKIPIRGVVENKSGFVCAHCSVSVSLIIQVLFGPNNPPRGGGGGGGGVFLHSVYGLYIGLCHRIRYGF